MGRLDETKAVSITQVSHQSYVHVIINQSVKQIWMLFDIAKTLNRLMEGRLDLAGQSRGNLFRIIIDSNAISYFALQIVHAQDNLVKTKF